MAESSTIDFSEYLQNDLKWYNAYMALGADDFGKGKRGESRTLHLFQSFTRPVVCGLSLEGKTLKKVYICSAPSAQLRFSIDGGMEIPHFRVSLRLQIPKQNTRGLVAVWTAWAEDKVTAFDLQTRGNGAEKSSFSTRLFNAHLEPIKLTKEMAIACQLDEGKEAYRVLWSYATAPYCFGFDIPDSTLEKLESGQQKAVENFRKISSGNLQLKAVTRVRDRLNLNWEILRGMSQPTYPPYPLYDARYQSQAQKMAPIGEIPSLDDQNIQKHHRRRELGWSNDPPRRPRYTKEEAIFCFSPSPAPTFVNERQYEAIRMIGLLREVEAAKKAYVSLFNKEYTFQLFAASSVHGGSDSDVFYAVLEVQVDSDNAEHEQGLLPLPEPRSRVTITPKGGQHQTGRGSGKDNDCQALLFLHQQYRNKRGICR
ncbi:hypothetical protein N7474_003439 [Penicillium riverlandense]|uniref:uncharacterized protein n=1 Tax=Penicillium riverlandense TaxID=1903569 RepID=UPI002548AB95|nr:uncharacterized protein N7474_003439 [Penicillium riverlandense]KAJ5826301.1 hypothetical protein N7474_003439 [Penicillium riverlandense]